MMEAQEMRLAKFGGVQTRRLIGWLQFGAMNTNNANMLFILNIASKHKL
jgi:hypothetical protein